jgi:hypothetical protein
MNFSLYDNFSLNEKIRLQARSINLAPENISPIKNSSFSVHARKPIKTLPDTPEQFLRSGSLTNKSKNSFNSNSKNFSLFESPKTVSSFAESVDHSFELKKLENLLKSKEKRLSEQELLLKIEKEEFLREKDMISSKFQSKKLRITQMKEEMREEREYLNRKINELDMKFIEVKEMIIAYEANKETIRNNIRNELIKDLNKQKIDSLDDRRKKKSNHQSFGEESDFEFVKINRLKIALGEQESLMSRKEEAFEAKLEEIKKLERTYLEKIEVLQNKETISENYLEVIENLQSELEFFREKCLNLEKELKNHENLAVEKNDRKDEEFQVKVKQLTVQQGQMTSQSLEIAKELQKLSGKEQELNQISQSLDKKSADLKQQENKLNEKDIRLNEKEHKLNEMESKLTEKNTFLNEKDCKLTKKEKKLNEKTEELEKAAALLSTLSEELEIQKKSQEIEQENIQSALLKLKKIAEKQEERENLIKIKEEKFKF